MQRRPLCAQERDWGQQQLSLSILEGLIPADAAHLSRQDWDYCRPLL